MRATTNTCSIDTAKEQRERHLCFSFSHLSPPTTGRTVVTGVCGDWQSGGGSQQSRVFNRAPMWKGVVVPGS